MKHSQRHKVHADVAEKLKSMSLTLKSKKFSNQKSYDLRYENLNEKDIPINKFGKLILREKRPKDRKRSEAIILEGSRLVKDALLAGAEASCLCFCHPESLEQLREAQSLLEKVKMYKISPKIMKTFSDTVTPGGLLGVFKKPGQGEAICPAKSTLPISLICDSLKDPGNAGTLIRTAAAVGCRRVFAMDGCVNLWERKVLRSAMGAHFHIPIYSGVNWEDIGNYLSSQVQVLLANNFTATTLCRAFDPQVEADNFASDTDQGSERESTSYEEFRPVENSEDADNQDDGLSELDAYKFHNVPLPVFEYSKVPLSFADMENDCFDINENKKSFLAEEVALVIGSEAAGLSASAKKFAFDHYGAYVMIPMNETTNSLNSGIAGSVILYELRKKLLKLV
ncbi:RNA methyltransferase-like protein 1 [Elysia marginata]|uniref:RNA methyltransferase-like protein 1 n=1 Tax=Elysia marginata TaxID=1093978 RepID=A0AAV4JSN7_9GAST|nr:RNA methyltransferase-like protein 1 [Elysia marginata]